MKLPRICSGNNLTYKLLHKWRLAHRLPAIRV